MKNIITLFCLLFFYSAYGQQTIDKLNVNQLKLPKESSNKALILDGAGQVKSSSTISDTELGYLEGLSDTLVNLLSGKANDSDVVKLTGNQSVDGVKTFTGKLVAQSTVNGSIPCPVMTESERDLFTPVEGDCVYNSDTLKLNVFDGSVWKDVGGAGGISLWLTANPYNVNDIIIESDKIYRCLIAHTSGTFATDLAASKWIEVSSGLQSPVALADGGTGLSITPVAGSVVYVDADSFEQLSPGSAGQVLQSNGSSAPSWVNKSVSAKSENGSSVTAEEIQVSNNQLTQTDTNKHLIESGNNNLLANPSFEHTTFSTGWTSTAGTFTSEASVLIHGKKSAKLVLSSQTMALTQDSTLYAAQFADGVQGLASVRIKSDVALKVCSRSAGVTSSSLCVDVQANNKWGLYKVPFILGATSNGIAIVSSGNVTGTVYIDDSFVGAASLTQNMNACNDVSCQTEFSAKISFTGVISAENLDWISTTTATPSSAQYTLVFNSNIFTVAPNCVATVSTSGQLATTPRIESVSSLQVVIATSYAGGAGANPSVQDQAFNIICQKQGADFTAAKQLSNGNTYSSTNADTDMQPWTPTGSWTTNSTYSGRFRRKGAYLFGEVKISLSGPPNATPLTINLPIYNGSQLSVDTSKYPDFLESRVGSGTALDNLVTRYALRTTISSSTQIQANAIDDTGASYAFDNAQVSNLVPFSFNSGDSVSINFMVPILGWSESNIIIGQFNGLESCTDTLECTDTFSAKVSSAGVVSDENVSDFINGNCTVSATSTFSCTFNSNVFTVAPNCTIVNQEISAATTNGMIASIISTSSSNISYRTNRHDSVATPYPTNIICQKQGVDYIGKTAKAVASDQNISTPGTIKSTLCSAKISATGVISDQKGGCFASCTNATTPVCTFTSNYWVSGQIPNCWHSSDGFIPESKSTTTTTFQGVVINTAGAVQTIGRIYFCHGERQ